MSDGGKGRKSEQQQPGGCSNRDQLGSGDLDQGAGKALRKNDPLTPGREFTAVPAAHD